LAGTELVMVGAFLGTVSRRCSSASVGHLFSSCSIAVATAWDQLLSNHPIAPKKEQERVAKKQSDSSPKEKGKDRKERLPVDLWIDWLQKKDQKQERGAEMGSSGQLLSQTKRDKTGKKGCWLQSIGLIARKKGKGAQDAVN